MFLDNSLSQLGKIIELLGFAYWQTSEYQWKWQPLHSKRINGRQRQYSAIQNCSYRFTWCLKSWTRSELLVENEFSQTLIYLHIWRWGGVGMWGSTFQKSSYLSSSFLSNRRKIYYLYVGISTTEYALFAYICIFCYLNKRLGRRIVLSCVCPMGDNTLFGKWGWGGEPSKVEPQIQRDAIPSCYIRQLKTSPESWQLFGGVGEACRNDWIWIWCSSAEYSFTSSTRSFPEVAWLMESMYSTCKVSEALNLRGLPRLLFSKVINADLNPPLWMRIISMQVITFKRGGEWCGGSVE